MAKKKFMEEEKKKLGIKRKKGEYYDLLEDAREVKKLKEEIEKLKQKSIDLAKEDKLDKATEISNKVTKKRGKRVRLIEDFYKKEKELKDDLTEKELLKIENYAFPELER